MRDMLSALLARLQADGPRDRGLKRQVSVVTRVKPDGQAKVGDADMLQMLTRTTDQGTWAVLQIRQAFHDRRRIDLEIFGIGP